MPVAQGEALPLGGTLQHRTSKVVIDMGCGVFLSNMTCQLTKYTRKYQLFYNDKYFHC